jgi:hypothetical protein
VFLKKALRAATASLESPPVTPKLKYPSAEKSKLCFFPLGLSPVHLALWPSGVTVIPQPHTGQANIFSIIDV